MMKHKGYVGVLQVDHDAGVLRGKVVNTRDTITFQGETVAEATQAFRDSVEDYLEFCKSLGEPPEKPFSGKFVVRIPPELHRELNAIAQSMGTSLNRLVVRQLAHLARLGGEQRTLSPRDKPKVPGPSKESLSSTPGGTTTVAETREATTAKAKGKTEKKPSTGSW